MLLEGVCKKCLRSSHPPLLIGIQPGLLLDLFASQEASEQSSLRPDLDSVAKSCATSSSQRIEDSKTLKASAVSFPLLHKVLHIFDKYMLKYIFLSVNYKFFLPILCAATFVSNLFPHYCLISI